VRKIYISNYERASFLGKNIESEYCSIMSSRCTMYREKRLCEPENKQRTFG
jgi:hypothetical protein